MPKFKDIAIVDGTRSLCLHCGEWIEYDEHNAPSWTHESTGYADCATDETYAEPDLNYILSARIDHA